MRKFLIAAIAALASIALASVAVAQTADPTVAVVNTPSKAGTKKKPKNVKFKLTVKTNRDDATVGKITVFVDKNVKLNGKGFKYCSSKQLNTQGKASCPKGSKAGSGTAHAVVGPGKAPVELKVDAFIGGKNNIVFYVQQGAILKALNGKVSKAGGKYGQKIVIPVDHSLQEPTPGLFSALVDLETTITAKKGKHYLVSTTGCKKKKQNFGVKLDFAPNASFPTTGSATGTSTASCKK